MMKLRAVTVKEAYKIAYKLGVSITEGDGRTFYATDEKETGIWEFDSKYDRDKAIERNSK